MLFQRREYNFFLCLAIFAGNIGFFVLSGASGLLSPGRKGAGGEILTNVNEAANLSFDAILILGGGVPTSLHEPPIHVQQRCDDVAAIRGLSDTPVLALSAGTAYLPQLLTSNGLPVWESMSTAAYLRDQHGIETNLYLQTTSYDTIGDAYFTRVQHTDVKGWKRLLVVTTEVSSHTTRFVESTKVCLTMLRLLLQFHVDRTKAIFDWIYSLPSSSRLGSSINLPSYHLTYFASTARGLTGEALEARVLREQKSARSVREVLAPKYRTLRQVWEFINQDHGMYSLHLVDRAEENVTLASKDLQKSYGLRQQQEPQQH